MIGPPFLAKPTIIQFLGRAITVKETVGRIAKVQFNQLCGQPHSAADFIELVKYFDTIILTDVPRMNLFQRNEARRFITLIDAIYENKVDRVYGTDFPSTK
jgi:protein AFG1